MKKVAIVYYSGTGNTEDMAYAIEDGVKTSGGNAVVMKALEFNNSDISSFDSIAFGCPAMGAEVLEETEFAPMFEDCKKQIVGKKIALFGSYGWGDGEWMQNWETDCKDSGLTLAHESIICMEAPDEATLALCREIGATLSKEE